jgi:uncharacterized protein (DUF1778 family)
MAASLGEVVEEDSSCEAIEYAHLETYGSLPYTRRMANSMKSERLELRLTSDQKQDIERAAAISGRSVTDFSVPLLVEGAGEVIRHERELKMSKHAWEAFNQVLDEPAKPLSGLADLLRRPSVFRD